MLILLSPAKAMNDDANRPGISATQPQLLDHAQGLLDVCKTLTLTDLNKLMGISEKLSDLNHNRFQNMDFQQTGTPAALTFAGDTYQGLDAESLDNTDLKLAQDKVRILSGLYGVLRPLDGIHPYRLEMGARLKTSAGNDLYAYWRGVLANHLDQQLQGHSDPVLISCASNEYIKAVDKKALNAPLITCHFKEEAAGKLKAIGFYAKKARGMMARFAIENDLDHHKDLRAFNAGGYSFQADLSDEQNFVFTRPKP